MADVERGELAAAHAGDELQVEERPVPVLVAHAGEALVDARDLRLRQHHCLPTAAGGCRRAAHVVVDLKAQNLSE